MLTSPRRALSNVVFIVLLSCASEDPPDVRDAQPDVVTDAGAEFAGPPVPPPDAPASEDVAGSDGAEGPPRPTTDATFEPAEVAPPAPSVPTKILPVTAQLLGGITVGCSYGAGTAGARWCAFAMTGATLGRLDLWVMNVSKPGVKCDGSSPDCLRLSTNLFAAQPQAGPRFPTAHRFYGDTLIFHADAASTASQAYAGPIYAWQPGYPTAKKISGTDAAFRCVGHAREPLALCIEGLTSPDVFPQAFDLWAGRIDGANQLKKIARVLPSHPTAMTSQWGAGFTSDGKHFIFSAATEQAPETLYQLPVEQIGVMPPQQVAAPGVSAWDVSPDGTKVFYMRDYNYSDTTPSGTLYMADFPSGANPVPLSSSLIASGGSGGVAAYDLVLNRSQQLAWIAIMQRYDGTTGSFRILKNPAGSLEDPSNVVKVLDVLPILPSNSPDLRFGWYFLNRSQGDTPTTDSRVLHYDGSPSCALAAATNSTIFGTPFLQDGGLVFWTDNYDAVTDSGDGFVASPVDCISKKRKFASKVDYWFIKGNDQVVYSDDVTGTTSTLRVAKVVNGELGPGQVIQTGIERFFGLLPNQEGVLYRVTRGGSDAVNGLYYYRLP